MISQLPSPVVSVDWLSQHIDDPDLIILDASIKKLTTPEQLANKTLQIPNTRFFDIKKSSIWYL